MKILFAFILVGIVSSNTLSQDVVRRMWVEPYVLTDPDQTYSFHIELQAGEDEIDSLLVDFVNTDTDLIFNDDGEGDDLFANDKIFTCSGLTPPNFGIVNDEYPQPTAFSYKLGTIKAYSADEEEDQITTGSFDFRAFTPSALPIIKIESPTFQYTTHVVNMVDADLESITDNEYEITKRYLEVFPDDRQTIMICGTETGYWTPDYLAASGLVSNQVEGLGFGVFNNGDFYYTENLEQRIFLNNGSEANQVFFHELHHRWGINLPTEWKIDAGGHYKGANSLDGSGFGGRGFSRIEPLGNDFFNLHFTELEYDRFNSLDMYLAGYGSIDEVNFPITVLPEYTYIEDNPDGSVRVSAEEMITITKEEFINKLGLRVPSYENSRKTQNLAMIVRSQRLLTAEELAYFHTIMVEHEKIDSSIYSPETYYDRTFEKGRLNTRITNFNSTSAVDYNGNISAITLYPNPTSSEVHINSNEDISAVSIINSLGNILLSNEYCTDKRVNVSNLSPGYYVLKYKENDKYKYSNFIKI